MEPRCKGNGTLRAAGLAGVFGLGLVFGGVAAQADALKAAVACGAVDTVLTDIRQHGYAGLLAKQFGQGLHPSDVKLDWFAQSGGWSVVSGNIPGAEYGYFFFETRHGKTHFKDVWGGMVDPEDQTVRGEITQWAEHLGAPGDLAQCFAGRVVGDDLPGPDYGFVVALTFSAQALGSLVERKEAVIVSASYSGTPTPEGAARADEVGQINLGAEQIEVPPADGPVTVTGSKVQQDMLQWTEDGSIGVNVNVFSARQSSEDNLISCDFIDGPLADIRAASMPIRLNCGLIGEGLDTAVRP